MTDVSERARKILSSIVECYLEQGQPIGSNTLAKADGIGFSASTIRNVMSELEEYGYLQSPHTSSGRVPTAQGYRLFVDSLLTMPDIEGQSITEIKNALTLDSQKSVFDNAPAMMSNLTSLCSLISLPKHQQEIIEHIEFLPLSDQRVLVVIVLNGGEVQNRIINTEKTFDRTSLAVAGEFINEHFSGSDMATARKQLLGLLKEDRQKMETELRSVMDFAEQAMSNSDSNDNDMVVCGQNHLLEMAEYGDISLLKGLFEAFAEKHNILNLLDKCLSASTVQIFIGEESGYRELQECSVIAAPYSANNQQIGVLAVIGPTRMNYKRVIPVVDISAKMLTAALNS